MSHDIDLIVTRPQLAAISPLAGDVSESRHLAGRKWRATLDDIGLDLYVPHQSVLGQHLELRTERLVRRTEVVDGWVVLERPAHLATKLAALVDRPDSAPGDKDRHEITALLTQGVDAADAVSAVHDASARAPTEVTRLTETKPSTTSATFTSAISGGRSTNTPGTGTATRFVPHRTRPPRRTRRPPGPRNPRSRPARHRHVTPTRGAHESVAS